MGYFCGKTQKMHLKRKIIAKTFGILQITKYICSVFDEHIICNTLKFGKYESK